MWVRFPLRLQHEELLAHDAHFVFEGRTYAPHQAILGYHDAPLECLVRPNVTGHGNGILIDQFLRFGTNTHGVKSGVNMYADGGCETFEGDNAWVGLEVWATGTSKLCSGRAGRYCVRGPGGDRCRKVLLKALWVPLDEVPPCVLLTRQKVAQDVVHSS